MSTKVWKKEEIRDKLVSDDRWLIRGLLAIYSYQTAQEQVMDETVENNGVGFNGIDAEILSSFAKFYNERGYLTVKQLAITRKKMVKYAGQLAKIANMPKVVKIAGVTLDDVLKKSLWVARYNTGHRDVGTYEEVTARADRLGDDDYEYVKDLDTLVTEGQPEELRPFFEKYYADCESGKWMTFQDYFEKYAVA